MARGRAGAAGDEETDLRLMNINMMVTRLTTRAVLQHKYIIEYLTTSLAEFDFTVRPHCLQWRALY